MKIFQTNNNHNTTEEKKKPISANCKKHNDTMIQPSPLDYQDLNVRIGLLHAYSNTSFSFDTARCNLLFYDWYIQKIKKNERNRNKCEKQ